MISVKYLGKRSKQTYMFDQSTLVLEGVTLAELVKLVVKVFVDLAGGTIFDEQASENPQTSHP